MQSVDQVELSKTAQTAQEALFSATTVFPFVLFPDTIAIDRLKVTITKRMFFRVSEVISIQISDLLNVEEDLGPIFGSLKIYTRFFSNKPLRITFLSRDDTKRAKQILTGYMIALQQEIDCSTIEKGQLVPLLLKLGSATPESK